MSGANDAGSPSRWNSSPHRISSRSTNPRLVWTPPPPPPWCSPCAISPSRGAGRVVVLSVHQPAPRAFRALDRVLLLGAGGIALWCGSPSRAEAHFAAVGLPCPEDDLAEFARADGGRSVKHRRGDARRNARFPGNRAARSPGGTTKGRRQRVDARGGERPDGARNPHRRGDADFTAE